MRLKQRDRKGLLAFYQELLVYGTISEKLWGKPTASIYPQDLLIHPQWVRNYIKSLTNDMPGNLQAVAIEW